MEQELNSYGDVSGGWIFDHMDRKAHEHAIIHIGACTTASANIQYLLPLSKNDTNKKECDFFTYVEFEGNNKVGISVRLQRYDDDTVIAYGTFLFIKRK